MKKEKILIYLMQLLVISLIINAGYSDDNFHYNLDLSISSITPSIITPMSNFTLKMLVHNNGFKEAKNLSIKLINHKNFILYNELNKFNNFYLCSTCSKQNTYFLYAKDLSSGTYPLVFRIYDNNQVYADKIFYITIVGKPIITFDVINIQKAISGKPFSITLNITNFGNGIAKNIIIKTDSNTFIKQGLDSIFIEKLNPKQSITKTLYFISNKEEESGLKNITLYLTYEDELKNKINDNYNIGVNLIKIINQSKLFFELENFDKTDKSLNFLIANRGESKIKHVTLKLKINNNDYYLYVGDLSPDDYDNPSFDLNQLKPGNYTAKVTIEYFDDEKHIITKQYNFEYKSKPLTKNNYSFYIILIILIVILIFFFLFRRRKHKF